MKLTKEVTDYIEDADAIYIIGVKGNENFTSIQGNQSNEQNMYLINQGMLGSIHSTIKGETENGLVLMILISLALQRFPQFIK